LALTRKRVNLSVTGMKNRSSIEAANYSARRETGYEDMCSQMLYRRQMKLEMEDAEVYLISDEHRRHVVTVTNPKTKWFEIYVKLKDVL